MASHVYVNARTPFFVRLFSDRVLG